MRDAPDIRKFCSQFGHLIKKHFLEWWRMRWGLYMMILFPAILVVVSFGPYKLNTGEPINYNLDDLAHPIYPIAKFDPETGMSDWSHQESLLQQDDMQAFMWYNDYSNVRFTNTTWKPPKDEEELYGDDYELYEGYYDPALDLFGPNNFIPFHCYSTNTKKKFESPIIGYIDNGSNITLDIIESLRAVVEDQQYIEETVVALDQFMEEFAEFLNPLEAFAASLSGDVDEDQEEEADAEEESNEDGEDGEVEEDAEEEAEEEEEEPFEPFDFKASVNAEIMQFLGDAVHQDEAEKYEFQDFMDRIGFFEFRPFASQQEIEDYVSQDGYGWDEDKPGLCFAMQVTEDFENNKYELELFFNDQWPELQAGIPLQQLSAAPMSDDVHISNYFKYQYNGFSYIQHFVANAILQRKTNEDAMIVDMIMPQKLKPYEYKEQSEIILRLLQIFYVLLMIPVVIIMSNQLLIDKQSGLKERIFASGVNPAIYWASWWVIFLAMSAALAIFEGMAYWIAALSDASPLLCIAYFFLANLSVFTVVWAFQPLCFSTHQSALVLTFVFLALLAPYSRIDQQILRVPEGEKTSAALSPMVAAMETLRLMIEYSSFDYGLDFGNFGDMKDNFSVQQGFSHMAVDCLIFFIIGCALEAAVLLTKYLIQRRQGQKLSFAQNGGQKSDKPSEGQIADHSSADLTEQEKIVQGSTDISWTTGLQFIDVRLDESQTSSINLSAKPGEIICIKGLNRDVKERDLFMKVLGKERPIHSGDIFLNGKSIKRQNWVRTGAKEIVLMPRLTAFQNLQFYLSLQSQWLTPEIYSILKTQFVTNQPMKTHSFNKQRLLKVIIELCTGDQGLLLVEDPTQGLDAEQSRIVHSLMNRLKQQRVIVVNTNDQELIDLLADQVYSLDNQFKFVQLNRDGKYHVIIGVKLGQASAEEQMIILQDLLGQEITVTDSTLLKASGDRQASIYAQFKLTASKESDYQVILEVLAKCNGDASLPNVVLTVSEPQWNSCKNNFPEFSESRDLRHSVIFELQSTSGKDNDKSKSDAKEEEDFFSDAQALVKADHSMVRSLDNGAKLLEFQFTSAAAFCQILNRKEYFQEKLNAILVEVRTAEIDPHEETEPFDSDRKLQESEDRLPLVAADVASPKLRRRSIRQGGFNLSVIKEEEDETMLQRMDSNFKDEKEQVVRLRCLKVCAGECLRQGYRGKWQILLQIFLPMLLAAYYISCISYFYNQRSESQFVDTEWLPEKQTVYINELIHIGDVQPLEAMYCLEEFDDFFKVKQMNTSDHETVNQFKNEIFKEVNTTSQTGLYGSYEFFELDTERHRYMFTTFVNLTSPHSSILFPQFMLEGILRLATDDPELEFKTKSTPYPIQKRQKGDSFSQEEQFKAQSQENYFAMIKSWTEVGLKLTAVFCFANVILTGTIVSQLVEERKDRAKLFYQQSGLQRPIYWLVRYGWDLLKYLPLTLLLKGYASTEETQLVVFQSAVMIFPFAYLPLLYSAQHSFETEVGAQIIGVLLQLFTMVLIPYAIAIMRAGQSTADYAEDLALVCRLFPPCALSQTVMFNSEMITWLEDAYILRKPKQKYPTDPWNSKNGGGDYDFLLLAIIIWWFVLLLVVDRRGTKHGILYWRYFYDLYLKKKPKSKLEKSKEIKPEATLQESGLVLRTEKMSLWEPHINSFLCIVCRRGEQVLNPMNIKVKIGEITAIIGASGSGKTTIVNKLLDQFTPMVHRGRIRRDQYHALSVQGPHQQFEGDLTIAQQFKYLAVMGKIQVSYAQYCMKQLGCCDLSDVKIKDLHPKQLHVLKLSATLASSQQILVLDEPFSSLDSDQKESLANLLSAQTEKAIVLTVSTRQDLEILNPLHQHLLDETIYSSKPYLRLVMKIKPQEREEVQDFMENFFEDLQETQAQKSGELLPKETVIEAVKNSTMSQLSIEQILDHLKGLPSMIDLEQQATEFLQIFKMYKVIRQLADLYGEIFIDWQVKDTVAVSFAERDVKVLDLLRFIKADYLVKEVVQSFKLQAQFDEGNDQYSSGSGGNMLQKLSI